MKRTLALVLSAWPAFAAISGTVVDLSGHPLQGVVVASSRESDVSKPSGSWIVGRTAGIRRATAALTGPGSALSIRNGRLEVAWQGRTADGKTVSVANPRSALPAARTKGTGPGDTLQFYYRGKRLVWLPLTTSDTDGVEIQIDTAWNDDFGIPWNARVRYGSLRDERDGHVYRTVRIGTRNWMAENLNYSGPVPYGRLGARAVSNSLYRYESIGTCQGPSDSLCAIYGRLYSWYEGIGDTSPNPAKSFLPVRGACPKGWRAPNDSDWVDFIVFTGADTTDHAYPIGPGPLIPLALPEGRRVEHDSLGFRALAGGDGAFNSTGRDYPSTMPESIVRRGGLGSYASFWSANYPQISGPGTPDPGYIVSIDSDFSDFPSITTYANSDMASLRCVEAR